MPPGVDVFEGDASHSDRPGAVIADGTSSRARESILTPHDPMQHRWRAYVANEALENESKA